MTEQTPTAENDRERVERGLRRAAINQRESPDPTPTAENDAPICPGCDDPITPRYRRFGVCQNCYNTTDDPWFPRGGIIDGHQIPDFREATPLPEGAVAVVYIIRVREAADD